MSEVSFSLLDDASAAAGSGLVAGRGEERVETMISTTLMVSLTLKYSFFSMFSLTFKIKWIISQNIPILGTIIGQKTFVGKAQKKTFFLYMVFP